MCIPETLKRIGNHFLLASSAAVVVQMSYMKPEGPERLGPRLVYEETIDKSK